jgi:NADPH:quinone reductase
MEAAGIVDEVGSGVPDRLKLGGAIVAIAVPKGSPARIASKLCLMLDQS